MIKKNNLEKIINQKINENNFIDTHQELTIDRSNRIKKDIKQILTAIIGNKK